MGTPRAWRRLSPSRSNKVFRALPPELLRAPFLRKSPPFACLSQLLVHIKSSVQHLLRLLLRSLPTSRCPDLASLQERSVQVQWTGAQRWTASAKLPFTLICAWSARSSACSHDGRNATSMKCPPRLSMCKIVADRICNTRTAFPRNRDWRHVLVLPARERIRKK